MVSKRLMKRLAEKFTNRCLIPYRQESKFWFSKTHQKAYATSIVNGELDKAMKQDEKEYQEKLKAEKGKFKLNK